MSDQRQRLPTLGDVAALAGVSVSTVSNVVRGSDVVAPATRRRVEAAAAKLGYRPNALARQLLRGRAELIGIIALDLRNPFLAEIASIAEHEIARFGYGAMFCTSEGDPSKETRAVSLMLENRVAGIAFISYLGNAEGIGTQISGRAATMFIAASEPWSDSVSVDERHGGELVADHLVRLGHRQAGYVLPPRPDAADFLRLDGFERVVAHAGGDVTVVGWDPREGQVTIGGAPTSWERILLGDAGITAIFASNDFSAIDLLDVADALGVRVPADLSVVGFDDVPSAGLRRINLTTVHQPRRELVRLGIEGLMARIEGRVAGPPRTTLARVDLRIRGTTAAPPGR